MFPIMAQKQGYQKLTCRWQRLISQVHPPLIGESGPCLASAPKWREHNGVEGGCKAMPIRVGSALLWGHNAAGFVAPGAYAQIAPKLSSMLKGGCKAVRPVTAASE